MKRRALRHAIAACLFGAACALSAPALADVPISENARLHFKAGVSLLQDPGGARYEDAYREFKTAYADSPSPRILGNMALCAMKLERDGEAIKAYDGYLTVPDLSADERRQTLTDVTTLRVGAAHVVLKIEPADATVVDVRVPVHGGNVTNVYAASGGALALLVRPGHHAITVKADGFVPQTFELEATPGATVEHAFTLAKPEVAPNAPAESPTPTIKTRPMPTYVYVAGGTSVALALGGVVTGSLALKKNSDFKAANNGSDPRSAANIRSAGEALNAVTDVLFVTAIVGGGLTAYLYVARPTVEIQNGGPPRTGVVRSLPALAEVRLRATPTSLVLDGSF